MPEPAFLFSIAGLSVTLAGFSGLVAAFRRGGPWAALDVFRLREIAEFGLANAVLTLLTFPLARAVPDGRTVIRIVAVLVLAYLALHISALLGRARRLGLNLPRAHVISAIGVDLAIIGTALAAVWLGSAGAFEWLLLFLLARPMLAFAMVLRNLTVD